MHGLQLFMQIQTQLIMSIEQEKRREWQSSKAIRMEGMFSSSSHCFINTKAQKSTFSCTARYYIQITFHLNPQGKNNLHFNQFSPKSDLNGIFLVAHTKRCLEVQNGIAATHLQTQERLRTVFEWNLSIQEHSTTSF